MKHFFTICLLCLANLTPVPGQEDESEVLITAMPDWVLETDWKQEDRKDLEGEIHYHLFDRQVKVDSSDRVSFRHVAYRYRTETGVQDNSQVSVSFDPTYQKLYFHRLIIHRDGEILDRMSSQKIKVLQREKDLNHHLYDGRLSAVLILEDIRVGDVLEYAYSRHGANPIFQGKVMSSFSTQWSVPIDISRYRLLWPSNRKLQFKFHGIESTPEITEKGDLKEYIWSSVDNTPVLSDDDLPSWYDPTAWGQVSEFTSWKEVADWAVTTYDVSQELPQELETIVAEINRLKSDEEKALAAVRYVQDQIRYLGVEVGTNSHKPYPLETIISRRFGDCKDKTTMLCAMLRKLGFEAFPALVNSDENDTIKDWLPTINAFDHVIVQLRIGSKTLWFDPTIRLQGGTLHQVYFPDYGKALVVAPESRELVDINRAGQDTSSQKITEHIDFQDYEGDAILRVKTVFRGEEADSLRRSLSESSAATLKKQYVNFYAYSYPGVSAIDPPTFKDDRDKNMISSFESYHLTKFWEGIEDEDGDARIEGEFIARSFRWLLTKPDTRDRTMPYFLSHPNHITQEIIVDFPWPIDMDKEETKVDSEFFSASYNSDTTDDRFRLRYQYLSKADHVSPEKFAQYIKDIETMEDTAYYSITVPRSWAEPLADRKDDPDAESPGEEEGTEWFEDKKILAWIGGIVLAVLVLAIAIVILITVALTRKRTTPPPLPPQ